MSQISPSEAQASSSSIIKASSLLSLICFRERSLENAKKLSNKAILAFDNSEMGERSKEDIQNIILSKIVLVLLFLFRNFPKKSQNLLQEIEGKLLKAKGDVESFENAGFLSVQLLFNLTMGNSEQVLQQSDQLSAITLGFLEISSQLPADLVIKKTKSITPNNHKYCPASLFQAKYFLCFSDFVRCRYFLSISQRKQAAYFCKRGKQIRKQLLPRTLDINQLLKESKKLVGEADFDQNARKTSEEKHEVHSLSPDHGFRRTMNQPSWNDLQVMSSRKSANGRSFASPLTKDLADIFISKENKKNSFQIFRTQESKNSKTEKTKRQSEANSDLKGSTLASFKMYSFHGSFDNRPSSKQVELFGTFNERSEAVAPQDDFGFSFNRPKSMRGVSRTEFLSKKPHPRNKSAKKMMKKSQIMSQAFGESKPSRLCGSATDLMGPSFASGSIFRSTSNDSAAKLGLKNDFPDTCFMTTTAVFSPLSSYKVEPKFFKSAKNQKPTTQKQENLKSSLVLFDHPDDKTRQPTFTKEPKALGSSSKFSGPNPVSFKNLKLNDSGTTKEKLKNEPTFRITSPSNQPSASQPSFLHGKTAKELMNKRNGFTKDVSRAQVQKQRIGPSSQPKTHEENLETNSIPNENGEEENNDGNPGLASHPLQLNDLSPVASKEDEKHEFWNEENNSIQMLSPPVPELSQSSFQNNSAVDENPSQAVLNRSIIARKLNDSIHHQEVMNRSFQRSSQAYRSSEFRNQQSKLQTRGSFLVPKADSSMLMKPGVTVITRDRVRSQQQIQKVKKSLFSEGLLPKSNSKAKNWAKNQNERRGSFDFKKPIQKRGSIGKETFRSTNPRNNSSSKNQSKDQSIKTQTVSKAMTPRRSMNSKSIMTFSDAINPREMSQGQNDTRIDSIKNGSPRSRKQSLVSKKSQKSNFKKGNTRRISESQMIKNLQNETRKIRLIQKFARWVIAGRKTGEPFPFLNMLKTLMTECRTAINARSLMKMDVLPFKMFMSFKDFPQFAQVSFPPLLESFMTKRLPMRIECGSRPIYCVIPLAGVDFDRQITDFASSQTIWPFLAHVLNLIFTTPLLADKHGFIGFEMNLIKSYQSKDKSLFLQTLVILHTIFNERFMLMRRTNGFSFKEVRMSTRTLVKCFKNSLENRRKQIFRFVHAQSQNVFYGYSLLACALERPGAKEEHWSWLKSSNEEEKASEKEKEKLRRKSERKFQFKHSFTNIGKVEQFHAKLMFKKGVRLVIMFNKFSKAESEATSPQIPRESLDVFSSFAPVVSVFAMKLDWARQKETGNSPALRPSRASSFREFEAVSFKSGFPLISNKQKASYFTIVQVKIQPKKPPALMMAVPIESLFSSDMYFDAIIDFLPINPFLSSKDFKVSKTFPLSSFNLKSKSDMKALAGIAIGKRPGPKWQEKLRGKVESLCEGLFGSSNCSSPNRSPIRRKITRLKTSIAKQELPDFKDGVKVFENSGKESCLKLEPFESSKFSQKERQVEPKEKTPTLRKAKRRDFMFYSNRELFLLEKKAMRFNFEIGGLSAFAKLEMDTQNYRLKFLLYFGELNQVLVYSSRHISEWEQVCGWVSPENQRNLLGVLKSQFVLKRGLVGKRLELEGLFGRKNAFEKAEDSSQISLFFSLQTGKPNQLLREKFRRSELTFFSNIPNLGMSYVKVTMYDSSFSPQIQKNQLFLFEVFPSNSKTKMVKISLNSKDAEGSLGFRNLGQFIKDQTSLSKFLNRVIGLFSYQRTALGGRLVVPSQVIPEPFRLSLGFNYELQNEVFSQSAFHKRIGKHKTPRHFKLRKSEMKLGDESQKEEELVPYLKPKVRDTLLIFQSMRKIKSQFCLVTLEKNVRLNAWVFRLYFPATSRNFLCYFYPNDFFGMEKRFLESICLVSSLSEGKSKETQNCKAYRDFRMLMNAKMNHKAESKDHETASKVDEPKGEMSNESLKESLEALKQSKVRNSIIKKQVGSSLVGVNEARSFQEIFIWEKLITQMDLERNETTGNWLLTLNNFRGVLKEVLYYSTVICDFGKVVNMEATIEGSRQSFSPFEHVPVIYSQFLQYFSVFIRINVLENMHATSDKVNLNDMVKMAKQDGVAIGYLPSPTKNHPGIKASFNLRDLRVIGKYALNRIQNMLFKPTKSATESKKSIDSPEAKRDKDARLATQKSTLEIFPSRVSSDLKLNSQIKLNLGLKNDSETCQIIFREVFGLSPLRMGIVVFDKPTKKFIFFVYNADDSSLCQKEFKLEEVSLSIPLASSFLKREKLYELGCLIYKALKNQMVVFAHLHQKQKEASPSL